MSERYPGKYLIGLTGNIAVGKSLARELLSELGAATIDADCIAHQVIRKGEAAYEDIIAAFGDGILDSDGEILRPALGEIVFADPERLKQLEGLTHPAIRRRINRLIRESEVRSCQAPLAQPLSTARSPNRARTKEQAQSLAEHGPLLKREDAENNQRAQRKSSFNDKVQFIDPKPGSTMDYGLISCPSEARRTHSISNYVFFGN